MFPQSAEKSVNDLGSNRYFHSLFCLLILDMLYTVGSKSNSYFMSSELNPLCFAKV